jgi:glucan phosphorylase
VPDDELAKKLHEELKPEMDRMWADHKRTMDLIFNSATDEQKREMLAHLRKRERSRRRNERFRLSASPSW